MLGGQPLGLQGGRKCVGLLKRGEPRPGSTLASPWTASHPLTPPASDRSGGVGAGAGPQQPAAPCRLESSCCNRKCSRGVGGDQHSVSSTQLHSSDACRRPCRRAAPAHVRPSPPVFLPQRCTAFHITLPSRRISLLEIILAVRDDDCRALRLHLGCCWRRCGLGPLRQRQPAANALPCCHCCIACRVLLGRWCWCWRRHRPRRRCRWRRHCRHLLRHSHRRRCCRALHPATCRCCCRHSWAHAAGSPGRATRCPHAGVLCKGSQRRLWIHWPPVHLQAEHKRHPLISNLLHDLVLVGGRGRQDGEPVSASKGTVGKRQQRRREQATPECVGTTDTSPNSTCRCVRQTACEIPASHRHSGGRAVVAPQLQLLLSRLAHLHRAVVMCKGSVRQQDRRWQGQGTQMGWKRDAGMVHKQIQDAGKHARSLQQCGAEVVGLWWP